MYLNKVLLRKLKVSEYCEEENYTPNQKYYLELSDSLEAELDSVIGYVHDSCPYDLKKARKHLEEAVRIFENISFLSISMNKEEIEGE